MRRTAAYTVLGLAIAGVWACFAPGHLSVDSLSQIIEVDGGDLTNRHATMLLALWYPLYQLGLGPAFVLALQIATFALGSYLVLRVAFDRLGAAVAVAALCIWPPLFGMLGSVGRDTWFAALMVATYGLLARAAQRDPALRRRWLIVAAVALWLALASRQNAFVAMVPAAVALAWMVVERRPVGRRRLAAVAGGVALTVGMLATQLAGSVAVGARDVDPEQYLYIYDLAALSERDGENRFPADVVAPEELERVEDGFRADSMVDLVYFQPPVIATPLDAARMASLRDAWLDRIESEPGGYLAVRNELFGRQLALTRSARIAFIPDVIDNPYGYEIWFGGLNSAALDYLDQFTRVERENVLFAPINGGALYAVWAYLLVAAGAAAFLLRRRRDPGEQVIGALALAALTLQLGLYFLAMGTEYRFEFPAVAAAILAGLVTIRVLIRTRTSARSPPAPAAPPARSK